MKRAGLGLPLFLALALGMTGCGSGSPSLFPRSARTQANPGSAILSFTRQGQPAPTPGSFVTAVTPNRGLAGIEVTISGSGFDTKKPANNQVFFGSLAATITSVTEDQLRVIVPLDLTSTTLDWSESPELTVKVVVGNRTDTSQAYRLDNQLGVVNAWSSSTYLGNSIVPFATPLDMFQGKGSPNGWNAGCYATGSDMAAWPYSACGGDVSLHEPDFTSPWIVADLGDVYGVYDIQLSPNNFPAWLAYWRLDFSLDGVNWQTGTSYGWTFVGATGRHDFSRGHFARYVRIYAYDWLNSWVNIKWAKIYGKGLAAELLTPTPINSTASDTTLLGTNCHANGLGIIKKAKHGAVNDPGNADCGNYTSGGAVGQTSPLVVNGYLIGGSTQGGGVIIRGDGFSPDIADNQVLIGGVSAPVIKATSKVLMVAVPKPSIAVPPSGIFVPLTIKSGEYEVQAPDFRLLPEYPGPIQPVDGWSDHNTYRSIRDFNNPLTFNSYPREFFKHEGFWVAEGGTCNANVSPRLCPAAVAADLGQVRKLTKIMVLPNSSPPVTSTWHFEVSSDKLNWLTVGTGNAYHFTWGETVFDPPVEARYVRIVADHWGDSWVSMFDVQFWGF